MSELPAAVHIRVRDNGPLVVDASAIQLVDGDGKPIAPPPSDKANVALCRCGESSIKPFCDGAHRLAGFRSEVRAAPQGEPSEYE